jgi:folate-dependent phosphoribosylglycinamide formyltransferase PurN
MNLLLLLGPTLDWYFAEALRLLTESPEIAIVGALVEGRPNGHRFRALRRELAKGRGGYVLVMGAGSVYRTLTSAAQPSAEFMKALGVPVWPVQDLYAPDTIELMRSIEPDLMFRSGFGIIREPVLSLAPGGVLSYHHGDIRSYRGQPVAFWELYNGEQQMTVTLQILAEKLDAGTVVAERVVPIRRNDSWRQLERRAYQVGVEMLHEACVSIARDAARTHIVPPTDLGDLYTLPNFRQWCRLHGKVLARRAVAPLSAGDAERPQEP